MYCSPGKPETMVSFLSVISVLLTLRAWRLGKKWYRCLAKWKKMRDVIRTIICCSYVLCLPALIAHPTCAGWQRLVEDPLGTICMERLTLALSPLSTCTLQILLCWVLVPQPAWILFMVLNPNQIIYSMAQCGHFSTQRRGVERPFLVKWSLLIIAISVHAGSSKAATPPVLLHSFVTLCCLKAFQGGRRVLRFLNLSPCMGPNQLFRLLSWQSPLAAASQQKKTRRFRILLACCGPPSPFGGRWF